MSARMHPDEPELELGLFYAARRHLRDMLANGEERDLPGGVAGALARIEAAIKRMEAAIKRMEASS